MKISNITSFLKTITTVFTTSIVCLSLFGSFFFSDISVVAYTSYFDKSNQKELTPGEISKVDVFCQNSFSEKTVTVNREINCNVYVPSDRSLPEDTIISIGNDYQSSSPTTCYWSPNSGYYKCSGIYSHINTGIQNIYLKINGNTEFTGDTVFVDQAYYEVLPVEKIKDLEVSCLNAVRNSTVTCKILNTPENYMIPRKASMHIGSDKKIENCTSKACLAHAGSSSETHRIKISYPGSDRQYETKGNALILPSNVTELDTDDYRQLIASCNPAPRNSRTNCELRTPENKAITKSYLLPSIYIGRSPSSTDCVQNNEKYTCEGVYTGVDVGAQTIGVKPGPADSYSFGVSTRNTVNILEDSTSSFTTEDMRNVELRCNPKKIDVNGVVFCILGIPEGKRINKSSLQMSVGENGRRSTCYNPQLRYLNCSARGTEVGTRNIYFHYNGVSIKKPNVVTVEKFEIISERDLPNMNAKCFDGSNKGRDIGNTVECSFTVPEGRNLPRNASIRIEGEDRFASCTRSLCRVSRTDQKSGPHNIVLENLGNGNSIVLDRVNLLSLEEENNKSKTKSNEYESKRNRYQINFSKSLELDNHLQDSGSKINPNNNKVYFGWNTDFEDQIREDTSKNDGSAVHNGLKGYARLRDGKNDVWTIKNIENGKYRVEIIVGSPTLDERALHHIVANDQTVITCKPTQESRWCEGRTNIKVNNNTIEIKKGNNGNNVALNLVRIQKIQ